MMKEISMHKTYSLARLALLLACVGFAFVDARADSITLNASTTLLDSTTFTAGTNYYAVFQLVGGGTDNNIAQLLNFTFTGGSVLARDLADPTSGMFGVGPAPGDVFGIGQPGATLQLSIAPGDAFSLYSQQIVAGTLLSFDFILTTNFTPGNSFDAFTFQLYDATLTTLLYEQQVNITGAPEPTPEPTTLMLLASGLFGAAAFMRRRSRTQKKANAEAHF